MTNILEKIGQAQMVLVGLGEELDLYRKIRKSQEYRDICDKTDNAAIPSYVMHWLLQKQIDGYQEFYQNLANLLKGKNYFVVSLCQDGSIWNSELDSNRIVTPCGDFRKLQCEDGTCAELYAVTDQYPGIGSEMEDYLNDRISEKDLHLPCCPHCGKPLVFNNIEAEH